MGNRQTSPQQAVRDLWWCGIVLCGFCSPKKGRGLVPKRLRSQRSSGMPPSQASAVWRSRMSLTPARPKLAILASVIAALAVMLTGIHTAPAHAEDSAKSVKVTAKLARDGKLRVKQKIRFSGSPPDQVKQKFSTERDILGNRSYRQHLSHIDARAGSKSSGKSPSGKSLSPSVDSSDDEVNVTFDPHGAKTAVLSYTVTGAVVHDSGNVALKWPLLQGLSMNVDKFRGTVDVPGQFSYLRCTAGPPGSDKPCQGASGGTTQSASIPTFTDGPRGPGEIVAVDIGFPSGAVKVNEDIVQHWSIARAFSAKPLPFGLALGVLVLGAISLVLLHRRNGRDAQLSGEIHKPAEFVPVGEGQSEFRVAGHLRPGQIGTILDERVDPIDITSSLLDLAVRGHVLITELPKPSKFARADWSLTRVSPDQAPDDLRPYEQALLDAVAPAGEEVRVSELGSRIGESIDTVQSELYDEMVDNGWFRRRPDSVRHRWAHSAVGGLISAGVITVVLAAFTEFGLLGLSLIILALGLVFVAQEMPARTAKGAGLLAGLQAVRSDLFTQSTDQLPPDRKVAELSEVLPYAVVLGGAERWIDAIVATDPDDQPDPEQLSWYHGPHDWHMQELPHSLRNFLTTVSGTLFSR